MNLNEQLTWHFLTNNCDYFGPLCQGPAHPSALLWVYHFHTTEAFHPNFSDAMLCCAIYIKAHSVFTRVQLSRENTVFISKTWRRRSFNAIRLNAWIAANEDKILAMLVEQPSDEESEGEAIEETIG